MKLADIQHLFQAALLEGRPDVLAAIPDGPKESAGTLLSVYQNAYVIRLIDVVRSDYPKLEAHLGSKEFEILARSYIAAHPSRVRNARWIGSSMAYFLESDSSYLTRPALAELARLEATLNDAFDSADATVLQLSDLSKIPPTNWGHLTFRPHPSSHRLNFSTNASNIWTALSKGEPTPSEMVFEKLRAVIVWRQDQTASFRWLSDEEAMIWDELLKGATFAVLCELLAIYDSPNDAPTRAARYLKGWVDQGLLSGATVVSDGL